MRGTFEDLGEPAFLAGLADDRMRAEYARIQGKRNEHHEGRVTQTLCRFCARRRYGTAAACPPCLAAIRREGIQ